MDNNLDKIMRSKFFAVLRGRSVKKHSKEFSIKNAIYKRGSK